MLPHATLAAALLAATSPAQGDECTIELGAAERFVQGSDAVVQPGERLYQVTALRGRVVVRAGAEVDEALALGGDLVLEAGARVNGAATSVGGSVVLQGNAWVGGNAVSLGGEVQRSRESWVGGDVIALAVRVGEETLARSIARGLRELARCRVVQVRAREPAGGPKGGTPL